MRCKIYSIRSVCFVTGEMTRNICAHIFDIFPISSRIAEYLGISRAMDYYDTFRILVNAFQSCLH